jgi:hypothetical protein
MANRYFGQAPLGIPQPVRASPPSPSQASLPPAAPVAQRLANRQPVRASSFIAPTSNREALTFSKRFPIETVLQAGGMNGAPIMATNLNGAPIAIDPMARPGSLGFMNMDTSVSARHRAQQALGALIDNGVPVSGDYTDAIRNAAGFAFGPKRMPKQGFMAASYSYPAKQMVVGATLAGNPIVNPQPTRASSPNAPRFVTRGGGQGPRGQISSSPSEDRRRLISTLQGLGYYATEPAVGGYPRKGCVPAIPSVVATPETWTAAINQYADCAYPTANGPAQFRDQVPADPEKARIVAVWNERTKRLGTRVYQPWTQAGRFALGLPSPDFDSMAADLTKAAQEAQKRLQSQQPAVPAPASSSGSLRIGPIIDPSFRIITGGGAPATQQPAAGGSALSPVTIGVGVAALAAVAFIATRK